MLGLSETILEIYAITVNTLCEKLILSPDGTPSFPPVFIGDIARDIIYDITDATTKVVFDLVIHQLWIPFVEPFAEDFGEPVATAVCERLDCALVPTVFCEPFNEIENRLIHRINSGNPPPLQYSRFLRG